MDYLKVLLKLNFKRLCDVEIPCFSKYGKVGNLRFKQRLNIFVRVASSFRTSCAAERRDVVDGCG
jgi:LytS/YehU family sensor histidine kinase